MTTDAQIETLSDAYAKLRPFLWVAAVKEGHRHWLTPGSIEVRPKWQETGRPLVWSVGPPSGSRYAIINPDMEWAHPDLFSFTQAWLWLRELGFPKRTEP